MFVAVANGEVVGWCDIQRHPFPAHSHPERSAWAYSGLSRPQHRRSLMDRTLKQAFATGFVRIEFSVRADNLRAMRLYEKFGFVREGVLRDAVFVDGRYHDTIAMALINRGPPST